MIKALWKGVLLAKSDKTIIMEENHYFPREDILTEYFEASTLTTVCSWKGTANYFNIIVNNIKNPNAAWYYPEPKEKAINIKNYVAFSKMNGIEIVDL